MDSNAIRCILSVSGSHAVMPPCCSVPSRSVLQLDTTVGSADGLIHMADIDSSWYYVQVHDDGTLYERLSRLSRRGLRREVDQFLLNIVSGDDSWIHHFDPEEKRLSIE